MLAVCRILFLLLLFLTQTAANRAYKNLYLLHFTRLKKKNEEIEKINLFFFLLIVQEKCVTSIINSDMKGDK